MKESAWTAAAARLHGLVGDAGVPEADVLRDGAAEEVHVLQHEAEERAQLVQVHLAHVDAVHQDPPARHVVEAQEQVDQRRLPRAGGADDPDALPRPDLERDVLQDPVRLPGVRLSP